MKSAVSVVSGINRGENVGRAAWYSGTVGGAREAVMRGVPAIALSLQLDWSAPDPDWTSAARLARPVIDAVRAGGLPPGVLLNVNFPRDTAAARGYRIASMGLAPDAESRYAVDRVDGDVRFVTSRWSPPDGAADGTDVAVIAEGFVPITPLTLDQTAYTSLAPLAQLELASPPAPDTGGQQEPTELE